MTHPDLGARDVVLVNNREALDHARSVIGARVDPTFQLGDRLLARMNTSKVVRTTLDPEIHCLDAVDIR